MHPSRLHSDIGASAFARHADAVIAKSTFLRQFLEQFLQTEPGKVRMLVSVTTV